jgi:hypothetical protein
MVGEVFDAPLPVTVIADWLLGHPLLAPEDARIFGALSTLLGHLDPPAAEGPPTSEGKVYEAVLLALAKASTRAPFVRPSDLGFEVQLAGAEEAEGEGSGGARFAAPTGDF